MAADDEFGYSGLVEWRPGQPFEAAGSDDAGPRRPAWHRDPRVLLGLIIAAMAVLVVASVVLLTSGRLGEQTQDTEMTLRPTIRTSNVTAPSSSQPAETTTATGSPTSSETTSDTSTAEEQAPEAEPEQASQAPAAPTPRRDTPEGPRTNVTRNPMSFTPGGR